MPSPNSSLEQVVADLVERSALLEAELRDTRWQQVGQNFSVLSESTQQLHSRLSALEALVNEIARANKRTVQPPGD